MLHDWQDFPRAKRSVRETRRLDRWPTFSLPGAGSSLATMLGRESLAVHVFEKARFSREKPCGEGLMLFCSVWVPVQRLVAAHFTGFHFQARTLANAKFIGGLEQPTPEQDV